MSATVIADASAPHPIADHVDARLVALLKPESFEADQYRILRHAVDRVCTTTSCRVIAVTSAVAGDGKTLTAVNVAAMIARTGQSRVLLIDADMRRPSVAKVLGRGGVVRRCGLVDAILDSTRSLEHVAWRLETLNMAVVTPRGPQADTYDILASPRFAELIEQARQSFDYVILDTPPVIAAPDSRLIAETIDGYLVVIAADKSPRRLIEETLNILGPEKVLGIVFNRESTKHSRYAKYYYAYHASR